MGLKSVHTCIVHSWFLLFNYSTQQSSCIYTPQATIARIKHKGKKERRLYRYISVIAQRHECWQLKPEACSPGRFLAALYTFLLSPLSAVQRSTNCMAIQFVSDYTCLLLLLRLQPLSIQSICVHFKWKEKIVHMQLIATSGVANYFRKMHDDAGTSR